MTNSGELSPAYLALAYRLQQAAGQGNGKNAVIKLTVIVDERQRPRLWHVNRLPLEPKTADLSFLLGLFEPIDL